MSASVGSYQTVAHNDHIVLERFGHTSTTKKQRSPKRSFTIDVVFGGDGTNVVDCGDGDVSIKAHERGRGELLLKL